MEALRHYDFDRPRVVRAFASERNDNVLVEDATARRFVVRHYRRNQELERIEFQLDVQQHLADCGVPTADVIRTRSGARVAPGQPPCVVFRHVPGDHYDFDNEAQLHAAARQLAQVHDSLETLGVADVPSAVNPHVERWWRDPARELAALAEAVPSLDVSPLAATLASLDADGFEALPAGFVHGDFHGKNLLFRGDEVVAVLDFDAVHRTARAMDVARAMFNFSRPARGSLEVRPGRAGAFIREYQDVRPLGPDERQALPSLLVLAWAPRADKCRLLARHGEDAQAWAAGRIAGATALAALGKDLSRELAR